MADPEIPATSRLVASAHDSPLRPESTSLGADPGRIADLVANGQISFPAGLPPAEAELLQAEVSARRRRRLVQFIGRCVAWDIVQSARRPVAEGQIDD